MSFIHKIAQAPGRFFKKGLGFTSPAVLLPYRGFGNPQHVVIKGHVVKDRLLHESHEADTLWRNFRGILSRYLNLPLSGRKVVITFEGEKETVTTDDNGYFEHTFHFQPPLSTPGWKTAHFKALLPLPGRNSPLQAQEDVLVIDQKAQWGIISDIDDTVLISHSTRVLSKLKLMVARNSKTRLPFPGVAEFYEALTLPTGKGRHPNPIFYVSSSEWNLYDFLKDFFHTQQLPKGPFLLDRLKSGLGELVRSGGGTHLHKLEKVERLLDHFPNMSFVLIGDSGQKDADLYTRIALENPERVRAIYIRDVSSGEEEDLLKSYIRQLEPLGIDMLLVEDTGAAARHAREHGFIPELKQK